MTGIPEQIAQKPLNSSAFVFHSHAKTQHQKVRCLGIRVYLILIYHLFEMGNKKTDPPT